MSPADPPPNPERITAPDVAGARVLVVVSRYYADIAAQLEEGARRALTDAGALMTVAEAPGAFEIPGVIARAAGSQRGFDGYVALGCVVRGQTSHYDYVCTQTARALMDLSVRAGLAIGFGVLTVESLEQAETRARPGEGDKGGEAARACLAMIGAGAAFAGPPR